MYEVFGVGLVWALVFEFLPKRDFCLFYCLVKLEGVFGDLLITFLLTEFFALNLGGAGHVLFAEGCEFSRLHVVFFFSLLYHSVHLWYRFIFEFVDSLPLLDHLWLVEVFRGN